MTNMPKLSSRAQKALDVLANGGRFIVRLERNGYTGREQFKHRLMTGLCTGVVRGVGLHAFHELEDNGFLAFETSTSVSTTYKLRTNYPGAFGPPYSPAKPRRHQMFRPEFSPGWPKNSYKVQKYLGTGTASVIESNERWDTREEAQAAADRANAGDETGLTFGLYADD
jgi:hypothetical protein